MNEPTSDTGVATETAPETETTEDFNIDSAVEKISAELFPSRETPAETTTEVLVEAAPVAPVLAAPTLRDVPKSWPKEMHEHWGKIDPKVQEYWDTREQQMLQGLTQYKGDAQYGKTLKDVIAPFEGVLQQYRLEPHQAVQSLMNAHVRLTQGTPESRRAAYDELGRNLGITTTPTTQPGQEAPPVDPQLQALQQQFQQMQQTLTTREQADYQAAQTRVTQEVEAFAMDAKAHPYFNEVADDITALLKGGVATSLQDAYDRAVRMNPVTYAKEVAVAQQAEVAKQQENARLNALKAKTAASGNVRSRESKRTPTEPLGTMEDTIKETLRQHRARPLTLT